MTGEERKAKLASYGSDHARLEEALQRFPRSMWQWKPAPNKWSIHEIVLHIADAEAHCYVRARQFVADPGSTLLAYDQDRWAQRLGYHDQRVDDALDLFRCLRQANYRLLKGLSVETWSNTVVHPERGSETLNDFLTIYERHVTKHIGQIERNYEAWLALQAQ